MVSWKKKSKDIWTQFYFTDTPEWHQVGLSYFLDIDEKKKSITVQVLEGKSSPMNLREIEKFVLTYKSLAEAKKIIDTLFDCIRRGDFKD